MSDKRLIEIGHAIIAAGDSYRLGCSVSKVAEGVERRLNAVGYVIVSKDYLDAEMAAKALRRPIA